MRHLAIRPDQAVEWDLGPDTIDEAPALRPHSFQQGTGIHYGGTCRISALPQDGVVNRNLQTHDHANLYICDGSALPTLPDEHLTLTIMTLAHHQAAEDSGRSTIARPEIRVGDVQRTSA